MKNISFEGTEYEVEDWVNWVARDYDGRIYGYENKPSYKIDICAWLTNEGKYCLIEDYTKTWKGSLRGV